eukprot:SAG22_NODE_861_length_6818_cov_3.155850_6_plen_648_part_00
MPARETMEAAAAGPAGGEDNEAAAAERPPTGADEGIDTKIAALEQRIRARASRMGTKSIDELASGTSVHIEELEEHVEQAATEHAMEMSPAVPRSNQLYEDARRQQQELAERRAAAKAAEAEQAAALAAKPGLSQGTARLLAKGALSGHGYAAGGAVAAGWRAEAEAEYEAAVARRKAERLARAMERVGRADPEEASGGGQAQSPSADSLTHQEYHPPGYFADMERPGARGKRAETRAASQPTRHVGASTRPLDKAAEAELVGRLQAAVSSSQQKISVARQAQAAQAAEALAHSRAAALSPSSRRALRRLPEEAEADRLSRLAAPSPRRARARAAGQRALPKAAGSRGGAPKLGSGGSGPVHRRNLIEMGGRSSPQRQQSRRRQQHQPRSLEVPADQFSSEGDEDSEDWDVSEEGEDWIGDEGEESEEEEEDEAQGGDLTNAFAAFGLQRRRSSPAAAAGHLSRRKQLDRSVASRSSSMSSSSGRRQQPPPQQQTFAEREACLHKAVLSKAGQHDAHQLAWMGSLRVHTTGCASDGNTTNPRRRPRRRRRRRQQQQQWPAATESTAAAAAAYFSPGQQQATEPQTPPSGGSGPDSGGAGFSPSTLLRQAAFADPAGLAELERMAAARVRQCISVVRPPTGWKRPFCV